MFRHAISPARFFTQVSNELIRHPRLSSDAVRLLLWQMSLPADAPQTLSETAKQAGIKKTAFLRAKRELIAEGYLHEWRSQGPRGWWSTRQLISNVPLSAEQAVEVRDGETPPADEEPAVGEPEGPPVGRHPEENTGENTYHPPGGVPEPLVQRGAHVLAAVSHGERRLRLTGRDVAALAPLAGEWLQRGAAVADLREALTAGLPGQIHSAAGLLRNRLMRKMPDAPTFAEQQAAERAFRPVEPRVAGTRECAGDHVQPRLFRPVADELLCAECRCEQAAGDVSGAVAATQRGVAAVRLAMRGGA
ncbi:hypothetical protein ACFQ2B_16390 [Streptomyces stramineus]|uniref:Helix-turn-helix domain-containing protein n=1 Tax=Streptomyces stramineus TaxID=173861 RepID=A0ABN1B7G5_9ACTN